MSGRSPIRPSFGITSTKALGMFQHDVTPAIATCHSVAQAVQQPYERSEPKAANSFQDHDNQY